MAVSTIPALRTALLARLAAEVWPTSTPQILRSHPYPVASAPEMIYLLGTRSEDPVGSNYGGGWKPKQLGAGRYQERYVQPIVVSLVEHAAADVATLELRAFELAGVITASMRAWAAQVNPFDNVVQWCLPAGVTLDSAHLVATEGKQSPPSREIIVTVDLAVSAVT